jgi:hypothetical protein
VTQPEQFEKEATPSIDEIRQRMHVDRLADFRKNYGNLQIFDDF